MNALRQKWLKAAYIYYHGFGEDSGMSDYAWDHAGREIGEHKELFPACPVINHPDFEGGQSLFFIKKETFEKALELYK